MKVIRIDGVRLKDKTKVLLALEVLSGEKFAVKFHSKIRQLLQNHFAYLEMIIKREMSVCKRMFSNYSRSYQRVWLKNEADIRRALNNPTWSVNELLEEEDYEISPGTINKIIKLSGLKNHLTEENKTVLSKALQHQMVILRRLYDEDGHDIKATSGGNEKVFRLIESDHNPTDVLTLEKLLEDIEKLPESVDAAKGERDFDIRKLHPDSESRYFMIKSKK